MSRRILSGLVFLLLLAAPVLASEKTRWIHVRVEDGGADGEEVRINVPVNLVDGVITLLEEHAKDKGHHQSHFRLEDEDIDREEMRRVLTQLRDMPEGAEVVVEKDGEEARFSRHGDRLQIRIRDDEDSAEVRIQLPMKLAKKFATSDEMNLAQALRLFDQDGEILVVDEEDGSTLRIWIDNRSASD